LNTINAHSSALVLIDYQAGLMPVIHDGETAVANAQRLAKAARILDIPVLSTEQNPAKLGPNLAVIKAECESTLAKTHFDACEDGLLEALNNLNHERNEIVIAGCEAHVCMLQTALGLLRAGKQVWVVASASGSRRQSDYMVAMDRLARAGATIMTHEMVMFEWLHDCRHPHFREVLALIKLADKSLG